VAVTGSDWETCKHRTRTAPLRGPETGFRLLLRARPGCGGTPPARKRGGFVLAAYPPQHSRPPAKGCVATLAQLEEGTEVKSTEQDECNCDRTYENGIERESFQSHVK
jgi:hypothetical protein